MTKRKTAGGYIESSDDSDCGPTVRPIKKPGPATALGRLSTTPRPGMGDFQLPSTSVPGGRGPLAPASLVAARQKATNATVLVGAQTWRGNQPDESPAGSEHEEISPPHNHIQTTGASVPDHHGSKKTTPGPISLSGKVLGSRSTLSLERQVNELSNMFEKYKESSDKQLKCTDDKLTLVLDAIGRLAPNNPPADAQSASRAASASPAAGPDPRPNLTNPAPTPELIALLFKVSKDRAQRIGTKKGGPDDLSLKEHARTTFKQTLEIPTVKAIRPYFEDQYGQPDTLPAQFTDPDTGYCVPHPHWKVTLPNQPQWVPTFLVRFKAMIPNDQSEKSLRLRSLTDEEIVILLHDGPFKTAQTSWREMDKSEEDIEAMRSTARRYQRTDRKSVVRAGYIRAIPSLQGQEWEYLYHSGYMSKEESDDEGVIVTKRPAHRAQWENNLYDAAGVAEIRRASHRPVFPSVPALRRTEVVQRPIPTLKHANRRSQLIVRIAACGLSKAWRETHAEELQNSMHLINPNATTKPDISAFLAQYPVQVKDEVLSEPGDPSEVVESGEGDEYAGEYDGAFGTHARSDDLDVNNEIDTRREKDVVGGPVGTGTMDSIPIDPRLLTTGPGQFTSSSHPECPTATNGVNPAAASTHSNHDCAPVLVQNDERQTSTTGLDQKDVAHDMRLHNHDQMPPPPLLKLESTTSHVDVPNTAAHSTTQRNRRKASTAAGEHSAADQPPRRGPGRPPGSKNKPKVTQPA